MLKELKEVQLDYLRCRANQHLTRFLIEIEFIKRLDSWHMFEFYVDWLLEIKYGGEE